MFYEQYLISLPNNLVKLGLLFYPHFADEESKAQRNELSQGHIANE